MFDEATSALDGPTAEHFAQTINALKGKVTMLFITHGLPKGLKIDAVFRLTATGAQLMTPAQGPAGPGNKVTPMGHPSHGGGVALRTVPKAEGEE